MPCTFVDGFSSLFIYIIHRVLALNLFFQKLWVYNTGLQTFPWDLASKEVFPFFGNKFGLKVHFFFFFPWRKRTWKKMRGRRWGRLRLPPLAD
jgi:hypothetical protein